MFVAINNGKRWLNLDLVASIDIYEDQHVLRVYNQTGNSYDYMIVGDDFTGEGDYVILRREVKTLKDRMLSNG